MTSVLERSVLSAGANSFGLAALLLADSEAADAADTASPAQRDHYEASIGRTFRVENAEGSGPSVRVRLTAIRDVGPDSFALEFTPIGRARLRDGNYVVRRHGVRTHLMALCAVGSGPTMRSLI